MNNNIINIINNLKMKKIKNNGNLCKFNKSKIIISDLFNKKSIIIMNK